jgi:hypothetical protein
LNRPWREVHNAQVWTTFLHVEWMNLLHRTLNPYPFPLFCFSLSSRQCSWIENACNAVKKLNY